MGYRGPTVVVALLVVLSATDWLRRLPPGAPLVTIASRASLAPAFAAAIVSVAGPAGWEGSAVITAALFAIAAVLLISPSLDKALEALGTVAFIGLGVAFIGAGVAIIGLGLGVLRGGDTLFGVAAIGLGVFGLRHAKAFTRLWHGCGR